MAYLGHLLILAAVLVALSHNANLASADVVLNFRNGTSISFNSVPIQYDGNSRSFPNVSAEFAGFGCDEPASCFGRIVWLPYRGWRYPYLETLLENLQYRIQPAAVLVYHETEDGTTIRTHFRARPNRAFFSFACGHRALNGRACRIF
jgi:hypothetical protein